MNDLINSFGFWTTVMLWSSMLYFWFWRKSQWFKFKQDMEEAAKQVVTPIFQEKIIEHLNKCKLTAYQTPYDRMVANPPSWTLKFEKENEAG